MTVNRRQALGFMALHDKGLEEWNKIYGYRQ